MHRYLLPALLLIAACAGPDAPPEQPGVWRTPAPDEAAAHDLSYTETFEIRFGDELVGYLVEVRPMPANQLDERPFKAGTTLIEDTHFDFLGFISPADAGYGGRTEQIIGLAVLVLPLLLWAYRRVVQDKLPLGMTVGDPVVDSPGEAP